MFGTETLRDVLERDGANLSLPRFRKQDDVEIEEAADEIAEGEGEGEDTGGNGSGPDTRHHVDRLADLVLQASDGSLERPQVLHWLLHSARGNALVERMRGTNKREETTMTRTEELASIAKTYGPVAVAKHLISNGPSGLSEVEFTAMVESYAKANGTTFVKLFEALDSDGLAIRKATQLLKGHPVAEATPAAAGGSGGSGALSVFCRPRPRLFARFIRR